ncbi:hypothetical protein ACOMHN_001175 [Nucella lapillus]
MLANIDATMMMVSGIKKTLKALTRIHLRLRSGEKPETEVTMRPGHRGRSIRDNFLTFCLMEQTGARLVKTAPQRPHQELRAKRTNETT